MERSLILFGSYFFQAFGLLAILILFFSQRRDIQQLRSRVAQQDYTARLNAISQRLEDAEQKAAIPLPPPSRVSLNVSKRAQVIRLSKRGEPVETIAATLGLSRREVELLLKVQRAARAAASGTTS